VTKNISSFSAFLAFAAVFWLSLLGGCVATTSAYVEADGPVDVEAYPQTYYGGRVVYWGGDRWYVRDRGAWFYYRSEPAYLYDYRARWRGYSAPPVRHYYRPYRAPYYRRAAPPAPRALPPVRRSAPGGRHRR
jgi:hypothetical protein